MADSPLIIKSKEFALQIIKTLFESVSNTVVEKFCLSVQDNNISGCKFWKNLGFEVVNRHMCEGFINLSMQYNYKSS